MGLVADNLAEVNEKIETAAKRAGRDPKEITLVAVSKTKPVELIEEAIEAGQLDFGENYAQELRDKMKAITDERVRWHFIGHLQKNKAKYVAGKTYEIHSIDRADLAEEIDKRAEKEGQIQRVMLEVNVGEEDTKAGTTEDDAIELAKSLMKLDNIELVGLMTMPPYFDDMEEVRPYYRKLRALRDNMREKLEDEHALPELSMGLSHDFEVAIEEGATRIRVGTAIFGERERR